jgi:hypothetical protein
MTALNDVLRPLGLVSLIILVSHPSVTPSRAQDFEGLAASIRADLAAAYRAHAGRGPQPRRVRTYSVRPDRTRSAVQLHPSELRNSSPLAPSQARGTDVGQTFREGGTSVYERTTSHPDTPLVDATRPLLRETKLEPDEVPRADVPRSETAGALHVGASLAGINGFGLQKFKPSTGPTLTRRGTGDDVAPGRLTLDRASSSVAGPLHKRDGNAVSESYGGSSSAVAGSIGTSGCFQSSSNGLVATPCSVLGINPPPTPQYTVQPASPNSQFASGEIVPGFGPVETALAFLSGAGELAELFELVDLEDSAAFSILRGSVVATQPNFASGAATLIDTALPSTPGVSVGDMVVEPDEQAFVHPNGKPMDLGPTTGQLVQQLFPNGLPPPGVPTLSPAR